MAAKVETMFYTREKPWHGLGVQVRESPTSEDALWLAGLGWKMLQKEIYTEGKIQVPGYKANVRDTDGRVLGVVTDRYKVIQNEEAFAFTDALLGKGVRYETAGSLQNGKKYGCWQSFQRNTGSQANASAHTLYSAIRMTVPALSGLR